MIFRCILPFRAMPPERLDPFSRIDRPGRLIRSPFPNRPTPVPAPGSREFP